jgi:hypothetical protein
MKLFAIHDPWFNGLEDGDVDDRAAFKYYERYMQRNPLCEVVVWIADLDRYELALKHFKGSSIQFYHDFPRDHLIHADKVCISAPVKDQAIRDLIASHLSVTKKGYCQGTKIGTTNFPSKAYEALLESIPSDHRYCTYLTNLCFPPSLLDVLDPDYKQEYMSYSIMKLISPGGIMHVPGLLYRLYCPLLGGGPGTNMLKIQQCLKDYHPGLEDLTITAEGFRETNLEIIGRVGLDTPHFLEGLQPELEEAMTVMIYFANKYYKSGASRVYDNQESLYSLRTLPPGRVDLPLTETPPLYDLVVAIAVLENMPPSYLERSDIREELMEYVRWRH